MILYLNAERVTYVTPRFTTALQSLEGTHLKRLSVDNPRGATGTLTSGNCLSYVWRGGKLVEDLTSTPAQQLLHLKCKFLVDVGHLVDRVRIPYVKTLFGQEYVYDRKYQQAQQYVATQESGRDALLKSGRFFYLQDEASATGTDELTVALEISRVRLEREDVFRYSERARRLLTLAVGGARTQERVLALRDYLTERNFKLPFEIPSEQV